MSKLKNFAWIMEKLAQLKGEPLDVPVTDYATFAELGLDELDVATLLLDAEDHFGVELATAPKTVGELLEALSPLDK